MNVYSQNDPQWRNNKIGFDTGPNDTIGNYGCYMTAIANVCSWAGNDLTPNQINDICKQNGWLVSSDLIARDDIPALLCNNLQFVGKTTWHDATSMNFFDDASDPNVAYIVCLDASQAPGIQTHFVMVWATFRNGDLEINDSWDGVRKPLSHYGNPSVIIQSATKFIKVGAPEPVPEPAPVVVEAPAPEPVPYIPPAAPETATLAEKYQLVTTLKYYGSLEDIQKDHNALGTIDPGDYYVFATEGIFKNLSTSNMTDQLKWVNILDNKLPEPVVPPVPANVPVQVETRPTDTEASIRGSFRPFTTDATPIEVTCTKTITIFDMLHAGKAITLYEGEDYKLFGYFKANGKYYAQPRLRSDLRVGYYMLGIPINSPTNLGPYLDDTYNLLDKIQYGWDKLFDKAIKTIEGIFRPKKEKNK